MGSLTSRPDIPQAQQPVFVTVPPVPAPQTVSRTAEEEGAAEQQEMQRQAREDNLLRRSRGRLGAVLTGLNGLLSETLAPSARKTLLGE